MRRLRVWRGVFMIRLRTVLQYRTAAWAGVCTQFAWGFMYIMIYRAFYAGATGAQAISMEQLTSYVWLQQAFLAFVMIWLRDNELGEMITGGAIACELTRPVLIYDIWYARLLAQRIASAALRCVPILVIAALLPYPYGISAPGSALSLALFVPALLLGVALIVAISMLVYSSIFKTMSITGSFAIFSTFTELLSGNILPVPLMPLWMQKIVYALPFRFVADFPFRVYSGNIPVGEAALGICAQALWLLALVLLGRFIFARQMKNVVVQGG